MLDLDKMIARKSEIMAHYLGKGFDTRRARRATQRSIDAELRIAVEREWKDCPADDRILLAAVSERTGSEMYALKLQYATTPRAEFDEVVRPRLRGMLTEGTAHV